MQATAPSVGQLYYHVHEVRYDVVDNTHDDDKLKVTRSMYIYISGPSITTAHAAYVLVKAYPNRRLSSRIPSPLLSVAAELADRDLSP